MILRTDCEFLAEARQRVEGRRIRPRIVYRTDRDERALALAAAGLGAVLVPDRFAWPGVTLLPVAELGLSRTIGLAWQGAGEALAGFRDFAASHDWRPGAPSSDRLNWAR